MGEIIYYYIYIPYWLLIFGRCLGEHMRASLAQSFSPLIVILWTDAASTAGADHGHLTFDHALHRKGDGVVEVRQGHELHGMPGLGNCKTCISMHPNAYTRLSNTCMINTALCCLYLLKCCVFFMWGTGSWGLR